mgnify:CR=1 FL=1
MAFIIRTTVPMMEEKYGCSYNKCQALCAQGNARLIELEKNTVLERRYGNSVTVGDSCDGIFDNGGSIKITVTTVTYRHREDGIR